MILNLKHNTWYTVHISHHKQLFFLFSLFTCGTIIWRSSSISFLVLPSFLLFLTFPAFPVPAIVPVSRGFGATTIHDSTRNFTTWNWHNDNTINKTKFCCFSKNTNLGFFKLNLQLFFFSKFYLWIIEILQYVRIEVKWKLDISNFDRIVSKQ